MSDLQQPSDDSRCAYSEPNSMPSFDGMAEGFSEEPEPDYNGDEYKYTSIYKYKIGKPGPCPPAFVEWATKRKIAIPDIVEHNKGFMTLQSGLDQILKRYATRKAWEEESVKDKNSYDTHLCDIGAEAGSCVDLIERCGDTIVDRGRRIISNDVKLTLAMEENQKQWREYIARVAEAQERTPTGLDWFPLLREEWKKQEELFPKFWDMLEKDELEKEKDILATVYVILLVLFPRQDFLKGKLEELIRETEAFFEIPPAWIEWDVTP